MNVVVLNVFAIDIQLHGVFDVKCIRIIKFEINLDFKGRLIILITTNLAKYSYEYI